MNAKVGFWLAALASSLSLVAYYETNYERIEWLAIAIGFWATMLIALNRIKINKLEEKINDRN